jgi:hypothetical protein
MAMTVGAIVLLGTAAVLGRGSVVDRGPSAPPSLPPVAATTLVPAQPERAEEFTRMGITLTEGWKPSGLIEGDDAWQLLDPADGVRAWIDRLPRVRMEYDDAGRLFVEEATVIADPAECYHLARVVRRVGIGVPPPAGSDIADQLEAWLEPPYFSAAPTPDGRGPCGAVGRSQWGFAIEQAEPLPCVVPDHDAVCFTLAKWRYDFGERDEWTSTHRAFDATSGQRLDDTDLHPGLDVEAFDALVDAAVCAMGGRCDGVPSREGRLHPTRSSIVVELSPGEAADPAHGSLRLTVPRRALPLVPTHDVTVTGTS